jgi:cytochrome c peroxidase
VTDPTPDPGAMLNNPPPRTPPGVPTPPRSFLTHFFKILPLWGVRDTAPYFHDNSAKTLEDVAEHYAFFFLTSPSTPGFVFTQQDQADVVALLKLLN